MTTSLDRFARRLREVERVAHAKANTPQLAYSSIEDGAIKSMDEQGNLVAIIGKQFDGTHTAASVSGPPPPTPNAPAVEPVVGGLKVRWSGEFVDALMAPMDFSRVEVHAMTEPGPATLVSTLVTTIESPRGGEVFLSLDREVWYVTLVARSQSGKRSTDSVQVNAIPLRLAETFSSFTAPEFPIEGDIWIDLNRSSQLYRWDGTQWVLLGSDGKPPSHSPDAHVMGGIGTFAVTWDTVDNPTEVTYEIHVSTDGIDFIPSAATLQAAVVGGGEYTIRETLADGTSLDKTGGTVYYAKVVARDVDGPSPVPGLGGSGTIKRVTRVDIEPYTITASEISDFAIPVKKMHSLSHQIY